MAGRPSKVTLNDVRVKNAKPGPKRRFLWDAIQPNFGLQVSEHGAKSWYVVAPNRATGKQQWVCLGKYPRIPLADARKAAGEALGQLESGAAGGKGTLKRRLFLGIWLRDRDQLAARWNHLI